LGGCLLRNQESSVGAGTGYKLDSQNSNSIPGRGIRFFSSPHPHPKYEGNGKKGK
jgi:hypothetical protein